MSAEIPVYGSLEDDCWRRDYIDDADDRKKAYNMIVSKLVYLLIKTVLWYIHHLPLSCL